MIIDSDDQVNSIIPTWMMHLDRMALLVFIQSETMWKILSVKHEELLWYLSRTGTSRVWTFCFFVLMIRWDGEKESLCSTLHQARPDVFPATDLKPIAEEDLQSALGSMWRKLGIVDAPLFVSAKIDNLVNYAA